MAVSMTPSLWPADGFFRIAIGYGNRWNLVGYLVLGYQIGPTAVVTYAHGPRYRVVWWRRLVYTSVLVTW